MDGGGDSVGAFMVPCALGIVVGKRWGGLFWHAHFAVFATAAAGSALEVGVGVGAAVRVAVSEAGVGDLGVVATEQAIHVGC